MATHCRVFAHLGLAEFLNIHPDYGMTCQQVFGAFAERHISATGTIDIFSYVEDIDLEQRMQSLSTWAPDWNHRQGNPRYRVLTWQAHKEYYGGSDSIADDERTKFSSQSSFGSHKSQRRKFTSKAICLASIKRLGRVLDTSSYEAPTVPLPEWKPHHLQAQAWLQHQSGLNLELPETFFFLFLASGELARAKKEHGSLLDGRRVAILDQSHSAKLGDSIDSLAFVPASSKEGDFIYYVRNTTYPLVLRPGRNEHHFSTQENRAVHLIGVCLFEKGGIEELLEEGKLESVDELISIC
jgi:hypothetical protein